MSVPTMSEAQLSVFGDVAHIRTLRMEATQRLLGDTIAWSDDDWQRPCRLPGWTRAHLGTHITRNADALREALERALAGELPSLYPSEERRIEDIERGSERSGLALQIDLDSTEDRLSTRFKELLAPPAPAEALNAPFALFPGCEVPVALMPLARLHEVTVHHVDFDCGFEFRDVDSDAAELLLSWHAYWLTVRECRPTCPICRLNGES
ncbi:MAG: maleylpyruvate isomerase family mycothiol-dependent enzyme [Propionibacteriaceae bacterium]|nr:maleylpyruvate isomerase family mycothiol-dependent enzyme [Propionibacteriaceae bacterium]